MISKDLEIIFSYGDIEIDTLLPGDAWDKSEMSTSQWGTGYPL